MSIGLLRCDDSDPVGVLAERGRCLAILDREIRFHEALKGNTLPYTQAMAIDILKKVRAEVEAR